MTGFDASWLALREPADAAARAGDLLSPLRAALPDGPLVICDLGCGTGSLGRWLAPRLPNPQRWILCDDDPALLARADVPAPFETRAADLAALRADDLADVSLVTASALLDILDPGRLDGLVTAITKAGVPALLTLSVTGRVRLTPPDPLDAELAAAFNAHQRRGDLLGPDAASAAAVAFTRRGARVRTSPSPWRLGPSDAALTAAWLEGWVGAAVEQRPDLADPAYLARRRAECEAGALRAEIAHTDLLIETP
ncbi:class I SAM-dependent methyltransferase [Spirillospora albida]|uniref:class I SAM-dependent methyltransferase n=1 Tax=Spirillospora albida TaxID=58123 RepID=UPI0004C109B7|nr:class I SAM-dependent methyltransferase [Spirillospora albida]